MLESKKCLDIVEIVQTSPGNVNEISLVIDEKMEFEKDLKPKTILEAAIEYKPLKAVQNYSKRATEMWANLYGR